MDMLANALERDAALAESGVSLEDFYAYLPMHAYVFTPSGAMWPASSVNAKIPAIPVSDKKSIKASTWLDQNRSVETMTWCPGLPLIIPDRLATEGGWADREGVRVLNLYRPPAPSHGDPSQAGPWIKHAKHVFGQDAGHIISWLACRVQHPEKKINHALILHRQRSRPTARTDLVRSVD
jgi:hypothetical protein